MPSDANGGLTRLVVPSDPLAVREALRGLFDGRTLRLLPDAERGTAEIVLAEVLNNVVEHAYASAKGEIEVTIQVAQGALTCTIVDHGCRMPGGTLPDGTAADRVPVTDLPEGGFGWRLIRALASELAYRRVDDRNELSFCLKKEQ